MLEQNRAIKLNYVREHNVALITSVLYELPLSCLELSGLNEYLSHLNEKRFGACLDTGHLNMFGGNVAEAAEALGKRLKVLHLHDNDGMKDCHYLPLMGGIDWTGFKSALQKAGYEGTLNLESKPFPYTAVTPAFWKYAKELVLAME